MRKPANSRAMRLISLALVVAMVMCGISGLFSVSYAEGETFTVDQVAAMAKEVYEAGKESSFAETAKINGVTVDQPTYLILVSKALLTIDGGKTLGTQAKIDLVNEKINYRGAPGNDDDSVGSLEAFNKLEYLYLAERQVAFTQGLIDSNTKGMVSNRTTFPGEGALAGKTAINGRVGYSRQLTVLLLALATYADTKALPETVSASYLPSAEFVPADPNATPVPTAGPSLGNFKMTDIVDAAAKVDPATTDMEFTVAGKKMSKASFTVLMAATIKNLGEGKTDDVTTLGMNEPTNGAADSFKAADDSEVTEVTKDLYLNRAARELTWASSNPAPANFATYNDGEGLDNGVKGYKGQFSYLRAFSTYVRVLAAYKANGALPETVDVSYAVPEETPAPTKAPVGTVKSSDVIAAAETALQSFTTNGVFPANVKVGSKEYTQASFFRMMAHVLYYTLGEGQTGDVPVYNNPAPESDAELVDGFKEQPEISKGGYLYAAQRQLIYMDDMTKDGTPAKVVSFPGSYAGAEGYKGQLTYTRTLVIFARALTQYLTLGSLPENVSTSLEVTKAFTVQEIVDAAPAFLATYADGNKIATRLEVAGVSANRGQYYKFFIDAINDIAKGNTSATYKMSTLQAPDGNGTDTFKADENDEITKNGYLFAAEKGAAYLADGTKTTPAKYITFSSETYTGDEGYEGQLTYQNQLVIYARVLDYYKKNGSLPEKVSAEFTLPTDDFTVDFNVALDAIVAVDTAFNNSATGEIPANTKIKVDDDEKTLNRGSYLTLAATLVKAINEGKTSGDITFKTTYEPDNPTGNDAFSSATISKQGYVFVAESQLAFMAKEGGNGRPANFTAFGGTVTDENGAEEEVTTNYTGSEGYTGNFSFNRACVVLSRVLAYYKANGKLPEEIDASYKKDAAASLGLISGSAYTMADGFVTGVAAKTTAADVLAQFNPGTIQIVNSKDAVVEGTATVGTGYKVQLLNGGTVVSEVIIVIGGDATGDGNINSRDIAAIQRVVVGGGNLEGAFAKAADISGDGKTNSRDIASVQRIVVNG